MPGPGAYTDQRTAFASMQKVNSLKKTPFMQSSVRFESLNSYKSKSAPGPGQYRLAGFAEECLRKAIIESRRRPAFGQTAERSFSLVAKKDMTPGPAQYKPDEKPQFRVKKENKTSSFASGIKQRELPIEDTPGPTAYDVTRAYENLMSSRREPPRNRQALKRQKSFNVVSRRDFSLASQEATPGPGAYDVAFGKPPPAHFAAVLEERWHPGGAHGENLPGPADYALSPMYLNTILKGTFNATLNNPLVGKKQKGRSESSVMGRSGGGGGGSKLGINSVRDNIKVA